MTKPWKLKTNSSNILLVLITLILIKAEWANGQDDNLDNSVADDDGPGKLGNQVQMYVGNDEIAQYFFHPSAKNTSLIINDVNKCLDSFQLMTCLKMLLLDRINTAVNFLEDPDVINRNLNLLKGFLVFEKKNSTESRKPEEMREEGLSLDEEISVKVLRMFRNRFLRINVLPMVQIEIEPIEGKKRDDFICFSYKIRKELKSPDGDQDKLEQGRKKRKGGGMSMMMMLPQLLMLGFMPFTLASLKAMVMNAVMINMMALNGAIFMTIRNLVFGPRRGDNVKYVNYGYSKDRQTQSPKPVLIIHSPAAFVKQPKVHKKPYKPYHPGGQSYSVGSYSDISNGGASFHHNSHIGDVHYGNDDTNFYYYSEGNSLEPGGGEYADRRRQTTLRRNQQGNEHYLVSQRQQAKGSSNARNDIIYQNDKVATNQRISTNKSKVTNQLNEHKLTDYSSIYQSASSQSENLKSQIKSSSSDGKQNVISTDQNVHLVERKRFNEFRPSPQWDPIVVNKYQNFNNTS